MAGGLPQRFRIDLELPPPPAVTLQSQLPGLGPAFSAFCALRTQKSRSNHLQQLWMNVQAPNEHATPDANIKHLNSLYF
jgi:hypothetical protein